VAVALVLNPSARWGGIGALALLLGFCAGISNAIVRGRTPDCNCFGQVHSAPVGPATLARNAVLAALAAILVWHGPGPAIDSWVAARSAAELVAIGATVAALALAAFSFRAWSENRSLRRDAVTGPPEPETLPSRGEPEGLPVGTMAPEFTLADMRGETTTLESLRARGRPVLLQFMEPGCVPCDRLVPTLARWQSALAERLTIAVVKSGSPDDDRLRLEEHGISDVLLDENADVFKAFHVRSNPTAIAVEVDGTVASSPARGAHWPEILIHQMIKRVAADESVAPPTPAAPPVPQLEPRTS
jgi:thiol-disulfide isomerase/thioredoxin